MSNSKFTNSECRLAYEEIKKLKDSFGKYHKTIFHIHSPASYDFNIFGENKKSNKNDYERLENMCIEKGIFAETKKEKEIEFDRNVYSSTSEYLEYLLFVFSLMENDVEIAVITDHNTIKGLEKIDKAVNDIKKNHPAMEVTYIIGGVELSCVDSFHMVSIFDWKNSEISEKMDNWITDHLYSEEGGIRMTCADAYKELSAFSFCYIAHFNSSDVYNKHGYLTGAYKSELFKSDLMKIIGVSDWHKRNEVLDYMKLFRKNVEDINFVLDNDCHGINGFNDKYLYVKGERCTYNMMIDALSNYDISISDEINPHSDNYIKGIFIHPRNNEGFFSSKEKNFFALKLSSGLNCLIGGRGTGKSSLISIIDFAMSQHVKDRITYNFVCRHGSIYALYQVKEKEYMIEIHKPISSKKHKNEENVIAKSSFMSEENNELDIESIKNDTRDNYLDIYEIIKKDYSIIFEKQNDKNKLIESFYSKSYSVPELINIADRNISDYIEKSVFSEIKKPSYSSSILKTNIHNLRNTIKKIDDRYKQYENDINDKENAFNQSNINILKINHRVISKKPNLYSILSPLRNNKLLDENSLSWSNIFEFFNKLYREYTALDFMFAIIEDDLTIKKGNFAYFIKDIRESEGKPLDDDVFKKLQKNENTILSDICKIIRSNTKSIKDYFIDFYKEKNYEYDLFFNVNSKVGLIRKKNIYKNVREISMGQKTVAMLDFVISVSDSSKDYRPLIIDQPEDNLDNTYIYQNLVKQFRSIKDKRQMIIATHNAAIVTNSMADQVIVLNSDGINGSVKKKGYPGEKEIKKEIVNQLEGGVESFKHKQIIYREIIDDNNQN